MHHNKSVQQKDLEVGTTQQNHTILDLLRIFASAPDRNTHVILKDGYYPSVQLSKMLECFYWLQLWTFFTNKWALNLQTSLVFFTKSLDWLLAGPYVNQSLDHTASLPHKFYGLSGSLIYDKTASFS